MSSDGNEIENFICMIQFNSKIFGNDAILEKSVHCTTEHSLGTSNQYHSTLPAEISKRTLEPHYCIQTRIWLVDYFG